MTNDAMKAFLIERYKHERLYGRGKEYGDAIVASAIEDLAQYGIGLVSKFESITGRQISYVASDVMALDTQLHGDGWTIHYDPPPIPIRTCDWHFVHDGYDGPGDWRHGDAATPEECVSAIRELCEIHSTEEEDEHEQENEEASGTMPSVQAAGNAPDGQAEGGVHRVSEGKLCHRRLG